MAQKQNMAVGLVDNCLTVKGINKTHVP